MSNKSPVSNCRVYGEETRVRLVESFAARDNTILSELSDRSISTYKKTMTPRLVGLMVQATNSHSSDY